MAHRQQTTPDGDVLHTKERNVMERGQGSSLYHNIPIEAREILDIEKGDTVEIEIRSDGYSVTVVEQ